MTRLTWEETPYFEKGLDRGVYYPRSGIGEAWPGLVAVEEDEESSDEKSKYIDGIKTNRRRKPGYFMGSIEAYSYPPSFYDDVFMQRYTKTFSLSYRIGNMIHIVYNATVSPSAYSHEQTDAIRYKWDFTCLPVFIPGVKPAAHLMIDTSIAYPSTVTALENVLYGNEEITAHLPSPQEVIEIFEVNSVLRVTDNGDGTFTVDGPDDVITMLDAQTFEITWPSAVYIDGEKYRISSL